MAPYWSQIKVRFPPGISVCACGRWGEVSQFFVLPVGVKYDLLRCPWLDGNFVLSFRAEYAAINRFVCSVWVILAVVWFVSGSSNVVILTNSSRLQDCDWTFRIWYLQCDLWWRIIVRYVVKSYVVFIIEKLLKIMKTVTSSGSDNKNLIRIWYEYKYIQK